MMRAVYHMTRDEFLSATLDEIATEFKKYAEKKAMA